MCFGMKKGNEAHRKKGLRVAMFHTIHGISYQRTKNDKKIPEGSFMYFRIVFLLSLILK